MNEQVALEMAIRAKEELRGIDATIIKIKQMRQAFAKFARGVKTKARKVVRAIKAIKRGFIKLKSALRTIRNVALMAFTALVSFTGTGGILLKLASESQELNNVINQSFGEMADSINQWAIDTADAMGRSRYQMRSFVGTSKAMLQSMIKSEDKANRMSKAVTQLAVDLGSFRDLPDKRAFNAITAGLMGETEPLARLGYNLKQAALQNYALSQGMEQSVTEMSEQQKIVLRYNFLLEQMNDVIGDAERTRDSFANQLKVFKSEMDDTARTLGKALLPVANELLHTLNSYNFSELAKEVMDFARNNHEAIKSIVTFGLKLAGLVGATALVSGALVALMNPIGMVIAGVATMASMWHLNIYGIREKTEEAWKAIKNSYQDLVEAGVIAKIKNWGTETLDLVLDFTGELWQDIKKGNWGKVFGKTMKIGVTMFAVSTALTALKTSLLALIGASSWINPASAVASIALITFGMEFAESLEQNKFDEFAERVKTALILALAVVGLTGGNVVAGMLVFTVGIKFEMKGINQVKEQLDGLDLKQGAIDVKSQMFNDFGGMGMINSVKQLFNAGRPPAIVTGDVMFQPETWDEYEEFIADNGHKEGGYTANVPTDDVAGIVHGGEWVAPAWMVNSDEFAPMINTLERGRQGYKSGGYVAGYGDGGHVGDNKEILKGANINNESTLYPMLEKLAKIAEDTDRFKHIVDLVSGWNNMSEKLKENMEKMEGQSKDFQDWFEDFKGGIDEQTKTLSQKLDVLTTQLGGFLNKLGSVTGNKALGAASGVVNAAGSFKKQMGNFGQAGGMLGKLSAGLGMGSAVIGGYQAISGYFQGKDEEAKKQWQEQKKLNQEQLDRLKEVSQHTQETANNLIKMIAKNPTNTAIEQGKSLVGSLENTLRGDLRPDFDSRKIAYNVQEEDDYGWFGSDTQHKTKKWDVNNFFNKDFGSMDLDQLENFANNMGNLRGSKYKSIAQDIADDMDWHSGGELVGWGTNLKDFQEQIKKYVNMVEKLSKTKKTFAKQARMESFEGIKWLDAKDAVEKYRKQIEETYEKSGLNIKKYRDEIDALVGEYKEKMTDGGESIVTVMNQVRGTFVSTFREGGNIIQSFASGMKGYFDKLKSNIAGMVYSIDLDSMNEQFSELFSNLSISMAEYKGDDIISFLKNGGSLDGMDAIFKGMKELEQEQQSRDTIIDIIRQKAREAGLSDEIINRMIPETEMSKKAEEFANKVKNSLSGAMSEALNEGDLLTFKQTLGKSIYESAKEGLVNAFMESQVYQQMFEKWFAESDVSFTGNLEEDFKRMQGMLDGVKEDLKGAGLDFGYSEVDKPTEETSTGTDYYSGSDMTGDKGTIINNEYIFAPDVTNLFGMTMDELFQMYDEWKAEQQGTQA